MKFYWLSVYLYNAEFDLFEYSCGFELQSGELVVEDIKNSVGETFKVYSLYVDEQQVFRLVADSKLKVEIDERSLIL